MVPVRLLPLFALTLNVTDPFPTPDAPPVIVIQGTDAVVPQLHPPTADTVIGDPVPAVAGSDCDGRLSDNWHEGCDTANVWPAMERLPVLEGPRFPDAEKDTLPFPVPLAPCVIVSHESVVDAVHAHPGTTVTAIDGPEPPPAATVADEGFSNPAHETS